MDLLCSVHVVCVVCVLSGCNWVRYPGSGYVCVDTIDGLVSNFVLSGSFEQCRAISTTTTAIPASISAFPSSVPVTPTESEYMPYVRVATVVVCVVALAFCVYPIEKVYRLWKRKGPRRYWFRTTTEDLEEVEEYLDMSQFNNLQDELDRTIVQEAEGPKPKTLLSLIDFVDENGEVNVLYRRSESPSVSVSSTLSGRNSNGNSTQLLF